MNNLELFKVNYENERITLSARDLHEFLESNERFSKWWERMSGYGFEANVDYTPYQKVHPQNHQEVQDYQITIEMAKEIAMLQRNDKGKQARQYFIELEKKWNSPECVMNRALEYSRKQVELLRAENNEMKPKAIFADAITSSTTTILVGELAKILKQNGVNIGSNRLFEQLRNDGYLIKRKGSDWNMPTQRSMELGLFEIKESVHIDGNGCNITTKTPKVTAKGQQYFINKYLARD